MHIHILHSVARASPTLDTVREDDIYLAAAVDASSPILEPGANKRGSEKHKTGSCNHWGEDAA